MWLKNEKNIICEMQYRTFLLIPCFQSLPNRSMLTFLHKYFYTHCSAYYNLGDLYFDS